jgi:hypothetical protein
MNTEVLAAFEALLEAMNSEKAQLADAVREATLNGQFAEAQRLLAKTERVERLMEQTRRLREGWERLDEAGSTSTIEAEREDDKRETTAGDNEDAPELAVVERLFGGRRSRKQRRRQAVNRTPVRAYFVPILEVLEELGGRGEIGEVYARLYEKMKDYLTEDDMKPLTSGSYGMRWKSTAAWARYGMVNDGLLHADSPRGTWEVTEAGRAYLQQARQQSKRENEP